MIRFFRKRPQSKEREVRSRQLEAALTQAVLKLDRQRVRLDRLTEETLKHLRSERRV